MIRMQERVGNASLAIALAVNFPFPVLKLNKVKHVKKSLTCQKLLSSSECVLQRRTSWSLLYPGWETSSHWQP